MVRGRKQLAEACSDQPDTFTLQPFMDAADLSALALSLAALQGLMLGFLLAAAALVFSSLATLASDVERLSVQTVTTTHERYLGLTTRQKTLLTGKFRSDPVQKIIVIVLARTSFYHREIDWDRFERKFRGLEAAIAKAHAGARNRLSIAASKPTRREDAQIVQYFMAAYPGYLTEFWRAYSLYADQAAVAGKFGNQAKLLTWPAAAAIGACLVTSLLNVTSSPTIGDYPTIRLTVAALLCGVSVLILAATASTVAGLLRGLTPKHQRIGRYVRGRQRRWPGRPTR